MELKLIYRQWEIQPCLDCIPKIWLVQVHVVQFIDISWSTDAMRKGSPIDISGLKRYLVLFSGIVRFWYLYGRHLGPKSFKTSRHILKVLRFEVSSALEALSVLGHSVWFCCVSSVHKLKTLASLLSIYSITSLRQALSPSIWIYNALHNRV